MEAAPEAAAVDDAAAAADVAAAAGAAVAVSFEADVVEEDVFPQAASERAIPPARIPARNFFISFFMCFPPWKYIGVGPADFLPFPYWWNWSVTV